MAIVTPAILKALATGFKANFQGVFGATPSDWEKVATKIGSNTASNTYGWLGKFPQLKDWVGDRVIRDMTLHGYSILNKLYEATVGVQRTDVEDDNIGAYKSLFEEMGREAKVFPDRLIFDLIAKGTSSLCYDGQNFFDTDHPIFPNTDGTGAAATVSNFVTGTKPAWYLLDTSRPLKPFIFQERTKPELESLTDTTDEAVFMRDQYLHGIRYRCNAGYGFWQMAYCSKEDLTDATFNAAFAAMMQFKADGGDPLGIKPNVLVVGSKNRSAANQVIETARDGSNPNYKAVSVLLTPWLE